MLATFSCDMFWQFFLSLFIYLLLWVVTKIRNVVRRAVTLFEDAKTLHFRSVATCAAQKS